jgi:hypothetical protein
MTMYEMMVKSKRAVLGVAALALGLSLAGAALAGPAFPLPKGGPAGPKAEPSIVGVWATRTTINGQEVILCLALGKDGSFAMAVLDRDGKMLKQVVGRYTYANGDLALEIDGKPFGTYRVTEMSRDEFVVNGTERWQRVEA